MNRLQRWIASSPPELTFEPAREEDSAEPDDIEYRTLLSQGHLTSQFSRLEYAIFLIMGVAMLWAWCISPIRSHVVCI